MKKDSARELQQLSRHCNFRRKEFGRTKSDYFIGLRISVSPFDLKYSSTSFAGTPPLVA